MLKKFSQENEDLIVQRDEAKKLVEALQENLKRLEKGENRPDRALQERSENLSGQISEVKI